MNNDGKKPSLSQALTVFLTKRDFVVEKKGKKKSDPERREMGCVRR